jgi:hypothetical protein
VSGSSCRIGSSIESAATARRGERAEQPNRPVGKPTLRKGALS